MNQSYLILSMSTTIRQSARLRSLKKESEDVPVVVIKPQKERPKTGSNGKESAARVVKKEPTKTKKLKEAGTPRSTKKNDRPSKVANTEGNRSSQKDSNQSNGQEVPVPRKQMSEIAKVFAAAKRAEKALQGVTVQDIRNLKRDLTRTVDQAKRESQLLDQREALRKPSKSTRSGLKRGAVGMDEYTQGKIVLMGESDARTINYSEEELEILKKRAARAKEVKDLKYDSLQYLIKYLFFPELKAIQNEEVYSEFHDRYNQLRDHGKEELYSEIRTTLFTNEQRDYINGYLGGLFETSKKDETGNINHTIIDYVGCVMLHETSIRIVKYVHKFETFEETLVFMKKKSREAFGISDDENDDDLSD